MQIVICFLQMILCRSQIHNDIGLSWKFYWSEVTR